MEIKIKLKCKLLNLTELNKYPALTGDFQRAGKGRLQSLTGVSDGEVRLALHGGGQLVHAQRHLPFEGRGLLTERREGPERALASQSLHGGVASRDGVRIGFLRGQSAHGQRRRG